MRPTIAILALVTALVLPQTGEAAAKQTKAARQQTSDQSVSRTLASLPVITREFSEVSDRYIRISDLFENAGKNADATVAYAPRPGKRAVFDARWLYRVAQAYKLDWRPRGQRVQVVVTRQSSLVKPSMIKDAITQELVDRGVEGNIHIKLAAAGSRFYVPGNLTPDIRVDNLNYDATKHRFTAIIATQTIRGPGQKFRVAGQVVKMIELPVLSRTMRATDVIRSSDIEWVSYRANRVDDRYIREVEILVGMSPRRAMKARTPVRAKDLREPVLVAKRSMVIIHLKTPIMAMTTQGRALESGSLGQVVRVRNNHSNKVIEAVVTGRNTVAVGPMTQSSPTSRLALK